MTLVTSDLHGIPLEQLIGMLEKTGFTDNDYCYILGDVIDRGEHGIEILNWLMKQKNVELIIGNHEDMLLSCELIFMPEEPNQIFDTKEIISYRNWLYNGGRATLKALSNCDTDTKAQLFDYLRDAKYYATTEVGGRKFFLVHGGIENFDKQKKPSDYDPQSLIWTRPNKNDRYHDEYTTIIGHTPTHYYGIENAGRAYITDTWIDIDTGAANGGTPMILRLDDMAEFYFN